MTPRQTTCLGCAFTVHRFRRSAPSLWCVRFHQLAHARCVDYRSKAGTVQAALDLARQVFTR